MSAQLVAPDCLAAPIPVVQIFDGQKRVYPSPAGYVLKPHHDYRIEISVSGVGADAWAAKAGRRPEFVSSAESHRDDATRFIALSTQRASHGWTWLTEFGADLRLTLTFDDEDSPTQHIDVPLVVGRPWKSVLLLGVIAVASWVAWLTFDTPNSAQGLLPSDWVGKLIAALLLTAVGLAIVSAFRWFVQPWWRYSTLRRKALRKLVVYVW